MLDTYGMDDFARGHFEAWLDRVVEIEEQATVRDAMLNFLRDYPELVQTHSWPDIRHLATR